MQHFVIKHVPQKPRGHKGLVQRSIDSNDTILLLNRAKNEIFLWAMLSPATPHHFVTTKTPAKISLVQVVKHWSQIEMRSLVTQIQLPLHGQLRMRQLSFRLFVCLFAPSHCLFPRKTNKVDSSLVASK